MRPPAEIFSARFTAPAVPPRPTVVVEGFPNWATVIPSLGQITSLPAAVPEGALYQSAVTPFQVPDPSCATPVAGPVRPGSNVSTCWAKADFAPPAKRATAAHRKQVCGTWGAFRPAIREQNAFLRVERHRFIVPPLFKICTELPSH